MKWISYNMFLETGKRSVKYCPIICFLRKLSATIHWSWVFDSDVFLDEQGNCRHLCELKKSNMRHNIDWTQEIQKT